MIVFQIALLLYKFWRSDLVHLVGGEQNMGDGHWHGRGERIGDRVILCKDLVNGQ